MIRQIWKVRNTAGGQPEPPPTATQETAAVQLAPQNDESNRKLASAAMEDALPPDDDGTKRPKDRQTLLLGSTQSASKALTDPTLSVCAFDPHSGTVYALVDNDTAKTSASDNSAALEESKEGPPTTKAPPPGILQMPAALTIATEGAGTGLSAEPVDEAAGSHPTASSTSPCDFSPLQDLNAAVAEHDPFARAMTGAAAESSNKSDRVSATNFLRFSPTFSSNNVVITNNGLTTYATSAVGSSDNFANAVIGSIGFSEGVHYWEVICPIFCNSIDFGVTFNPHKVTKNNTISEQFLSTTKRTVGVMLDLSRGQISFWLNSRMLKKNKTKELKKPGLTWYPYIRLQEPNIPAILNPFCRLPMADTLAPKFRKKLPQSLTNHSLSHG